MSVLTSNELINLLNRIDDFVEKITKEFQRLKHSPVSAWMHNKKYHKLLSSNTDKLSDDEKSHRSYLIRELESISIDGITINESETHLKEYLSLLVKFNSKSNLFSVLEDTFNSSDKLESIKNLLESLNAKIVEVEAMNILKEFSGFLGSHLISINTQIDIILNELYSIESRNFDNNKLRLNQKLIIQYYLNKFGHISLNKIHQDVVKQSIVLSALYGVHTENTRKGLLSLNPDNPKIFTKRNLKLIIPIFEEFGDSEIIEEINKDLELVS